MSGELPLPLASTSLIHGLSKTQKGFCMHQQKYIGLQNGLIALFCLKMGFKGIKTLKSKFWHGLDCLEMPENPKKKISSDSRVFADWYPFADACMQTQHCAQMHTTTPCTYRETTRAGWVRGDDDAHTRDSMRRCRATLCIHARTHPHTRRRRRMRTHATHSCRLDAAHKCTHAPALWPTPHTHRTQQRARTRACNDACRRWRWRARRRCGGHITCTLL